MKSHAPDRIGLSPRSGRNWAVSRRGFTLVELLVVIAIIGILAGLLLPAVNTVKKKGFESRAMVEVKALDAALRQYYAEYGKFPDLTPDVFGKDKDNKNLVSALSSNNPRKIMFLEVQEENRDADGNFVDPWGSQYRAVVDHDFDNQVDTKISGVGTLTRPVAVWTTNSTKMLKSW